MTQSEIKHSLNRKFVRVQPDLTLEHLRLIAFNRFEFYERIGIAFGGLGRFYAHQVLNGRYIPVKDRTIEKIAKALGVSVKRLSELFEWLRQERLCLEATEQRQVE